MKKWTTLAFIAVLAALVRAEVPMAINFSGCLEEISGSNAEAVDGASVYMAFRIYADEKASVTNAVWARQVMVALEDGVFDVELSDSLGTALPGYEDSTLSDAITWATGGTNAFWIGLTPGDPNNAEISPRQRVDNVVRAIQAEDVRRVPENFTVGERLIIDDASELIVGGTDGSATFNGRAEYNSVSFDKTPTFDGGFAVEGKMAAGSIDLVTNLEAGVIKVTDLDAKNVKTPILTASEEAIWKSGRMIVTTARVERVEAPLNVNGAASSTATLLDASKLEIRSSEKLQKNDKWSPIGGLYAVAESEYAQADVAGTIDSENFSYIHPASMQRLNVSSVYAGSWTAPKDCIAYFETYLYDLHGDGACVQFYVAQSPTTRLFQSRTPSGVAICQGAGQTLRTVVPIVLRAGETVQWLGYNNNKLEGQTKVQSNDTRVEKISYRAFGWSEKKEESK